jgi:hypothetical protein
MLQSIHFLFKIILSRNKYFQTDTRPLMNPYFMYFLLNLEIRKSEMSI